MAKKRVVKKAPSASRPKAPGTDKKCEFPCIKIKQFDYDLVMFSCSGKALWDIVKINRREEDKDAGYQRVLSSSRAEKIARFINARNVIPVSILVCFDEGQVKNGKLIVPRRPDAGWVIDGQHRLEGSHRAEEDIVLPIIAFIGLDEAEQIKCFVTINKEHKGVPSSLYLDLLKKLPGTRTSTEVLQERAADLANEMKYDEESPFYNRIVITTAPKVGQLSLANWVRKVYPHLNEKSGRLATFNDEDRAMILNNYFVGLGQVFPKEFKRPESIFFKTLGFGAMMNVFPTFFDITIQQEKNFRVADVVKTFKRIDHFDFAGWQHMGAGNLAETTAGDDLRTELTDSIATGTTGGIALK